MSTELSNGVIIPEEYSDDWYDEMSINLRKLNDVITAASDNATDIQRLDTDKANQSDLTALTSRVSQNETDIIALQTAVSGALKREIVQTLPTEDISTTTIYMIRNSQSSGTNIYDEYMYINSQWELIGTSATDFSNYYTKNETDNLLSGKVDNSTLGSYYTKTESDNLLSAKANQTDLTALGGRVTQTETDITALQTAVSGALKREIVQTLPTQDISTTTIYMIRNTTTSGDNIYDEYMYINSQWELIGTSATDFSNYYTKTEIDTLLAGKADDNSVVHTSGEETITGTKRFGVVQNFTGYPSIRLYSPIDDVNVLPSAIEQRDIRFTDKNNVPIAYFLFQHRNDANEPFRTCWRQCRLDGTENYYSVNFNNLGEFYPENNNAIKLGTSTKRWASIYATNYYYGANNVEFSTKFVTSDTAQTISGAKTFSSNTIIYNSDTSANTPNLILQSSKIQLGDTSNSDTQGVIFNAGSSYVARVDSYKDGSGTQNLQYRVRTKDTDNNIISAMYRLRMFNSGSAYLESESDNQISLGRNNARWKDCQTYLINGLTPSSLSMPSGNASDFIDISSYFTNTGSGDTNTYTAPANGWVYLFVTACKTLTAYIQTATDTLYSDYRERSSDGQIRMMLPIQRNNKFTSYWTTSSTVSITKAVFIPCQGNV